MSHVRPPFDPLQFLYDLRLDVRLGRNGKIVLEGMSKIPQERRRQALKVVKVYDKLLRIQLDAPNEGMRPSVRKLLAQGKIKVEGGRYVKGDAHDH